MKVDATLDEVTAVAEFRAALRHFLSETDRLTRMRGLSPRRYELLLAIYAAGDQGATMGEIANRLRLTPQTVTELVTRAVTDHLVTRSHDCDDGRVTRITLTSSARQRLLAAVADLRPERQRLGELLAAAYAHAQALTEATATRKRAEPPQQGRRQRPAEPVR